MNTAAAMPPDPVLRVAGVPRSVLAALNTPESHALAETVLAEQERIDAEGRAVADALHAVIGALPDPAPRPRVIGLRRAAHQGRTPRTTEWDAAVQAALPAPLAARVEGWLAARARQEQRRAALADTLARETEAVLGALRGPLTDPSFRQGLLHGSRGLDDVLERWLDTPHGRAPGTKVLVSLARYLSRAAAKTSPYSTFTATGQARWRPSGPWLDFGDMTRRPVQAEINLARLRRIADALLRTRPELRATLRLRSNPALHASPEAIRLIPPTAGARITALPAPGQLSRLMEAVRQVDGLTAAEAGPAVGRFLAAGILQEDLPLDDAAPCHLTALTAWLEEAAPELAPVGAALHGLRMELTRHQSASTHSERRRRDRAVRERLRSVEDALGLPAPRESYERRPFHEDSVLGGDAATLGHPHWRPLLADLTATGRALAVLDRDLPARHAAAAWLTERHGPAARVPLLLVLHQLQDEQSPAAQRVRDLLDPGFGTDDELLAASPLPVLRRLAGERRRVTAALHAGDLPTGLALPRPPLSLAHYVQPLAGPDGRPYAVLNAVTAGHGHWQGRLDRIHARATGRPVPPGPAAPASVSDPLPVDLGGLYASNTNLRRPTVPHVFDHPFTRDSRPAHQRIALGEVTVHVDTATGLPALHAPRPAVDLVPVHLGLMSPQLLPPPLATVLRLFGDPHTLLRTGHPLQPGPFTDDVPADGIRHLPRLRAGNVVLRRRGWLTRAASVPLPRPGEHGHDHLLRLLAWQRAVGLPQRCFARTRPAGGPAPDPFADKGYKPAYVDFASPLLTAAFTRALTAPDTVVHIEEALPDPAADQGPGTGPYTTELVIELPAGPPSGLPGEHRAGA
ncbi:lantibiotic dehydratase [Streptomyces mobaraensis]|uniref:lantibiotic dehydratase n=1 Tax=Streptomyces mobaraensis TaxID=35621 RepID=UPI0033E67027